MKVTITTIFAMILSLNVFAFDSSYKATDDWYEKINGFKTIFFQIDNERNRISFKGSPWFSKENGFEIISDENEEILAVSRSGNTLLLIDFNAMTLKSGDHHGSFQFGKYLTVSFQQIH